MTRQGILLRTDNYFHMGWLSRLMLLPREPPTTLIPSGEPFKAFVDGWDTCDETGQALAFEAFERMLPLKQVSVAWTTDDEIPEGDP